MKLKYKTLRVTMPDASRYDVPVEIIALNRAKSYAHEFDDDIEKSLDKDTAPLFNDDTYEITDWASNNMNWEDVEKYAEKVPAKKVETDFQEGWCNGDKEVLK